MEGALTLLREDSEQKLKYQGAELPEEGLGVSFDGIRKGTCKVSDYW